jgi:hypothetical protein
MQGTPVRHVAAQVALILSLGALAMGVGVTRARADADFGLTVQHLLNTFSWQWFGVSEPLEESALGPFTELDNTQALEVAKSLQVSAVSNATSPLADMIALWPNDEHPTHLFVCVENSFSGDSNPDIVSVRRVDLSDEPNSNAVTIIKGLSACDPIHRTPWGSLIVDEEAGSTGGFYEILDPLALSGANPVIILSRAAGTTSDPQHVVKRKAIGSLSFEGIVITEDGTTYVGDENRPSQGRAGGGLFKFVPQSPYDPTMGVITDPEQSPLASGTIYGMRLGTMSNNTDYGQGSETGKGIWIMIDPARFTDGGGNILLREAQLALGLTGYYRPKTWTATRSPLHRVSRACIGRIRDG